MKINREALKAELSGRVILTEDDRERVLDVIEDYFKSYSEKIIENNTVDSIGEITDDAIEQCYQASDPEWRKVALDIVRQMCYEKQYFTVNDFRKNLKGKTHDNRAVGGLMRTAQAEKWCRPTGNTIQSKVGHKSLLQIWESRIRILL